MLYDLLQFIKEETTIRLVDTDTGEILYRGKAEECPGVRYEFIVAYTRTREGTKHNNFTPELEIYGNKI